MLTTHLYEGVVAVDGPVIACTQIKLEGRRVGARTAGRPEQVADRRATGACFAALLGNGVAEIHAGRIGIDQRR